MLPARPPGTPRRAPRRAFLPAPPLALLLASLLALCLLPALSGTAHAAERTLAGGRLDWGIRSSFQTYVTGPIAGGSWSVSGGAATVGESQFRFHTARGSYDPGSGALTAGYTGGVRFTGHREEDGTYQLDLTVSDPTVRVDGATGTLHADVRSRDRSSGRVTEAAQVPLADLDFSGVDLRGGTRIAVTGIPATLTAEGARAFAGYYRAGDPLDPVSLTADSEDPALPPGATADPDEDEDEGGDGGSEAGGEDATDAGEPALAGGAVDWGVRRTFREYVTGPVAEGAWELSGGARDGGALFRFPAGEGTADLEAGTARAAFEGRVHFTGNGLDLALGGLTVTVAEGTGTLAADVTADGEALEDRPLVTFPAAAGDLEPEDGLILLQEVPTELTEEGAEALAGLYPPGTAMDPLTLALTTSGADLPPLPDLGSDPDGAATPAAGEEAERAGESGQREDAAPAADGSSGPGPAVWLAGGTGLLALAAATFLILRRARRTTTTPAAEENDRT
ncbi:HtaA domain-containing protein [Streptomyces sp. DSM 44917]|uniref:HtaA domain-containing protein n=1 Tax=Streptomyces boetiae TaxID=3075541 RepID=A0ABU2L4D6_9ACTN|nr:HtaA domain-containing protein [Streptomyces sp. DSM 44917]MDT0306232.1 HtaA domain-containing protein [Streptomyces sp. DSM 44917]